MFAAREKGVAVVNRKTANFRVLPDGNGRRYQFFCALSGAHVCTTRPILSRPWKTSLTSDAEES